MTGTRTDAAVVAQRHLGAARQRLVGHAELAGRQRAAAAEVPAVQAGAVPRRQRGAVHVQPPEPERAGRAAGADLHANAGAQRAGARRSRSRSAPRASVRSRSSVTQRPSRRICSATVEPAAGSCAAHDGAAGPPHVQMALATRRPSRRSRWVCPGFRRALRRARPPRRHMPGKARRRSRQRANRAWASRRGPPSVVVSVRPQRPVRDGSWQLRPRHAHRSHTRPGIVPCRLGGRTSVRC